MYNSTPSCSIFSPCHSDWVDRDLVRSMSHPALCAFRKVQVRRVVVTFLPCKDDDIKAPWDVAKNENWTRKWEVKSHKKKNGTRAYLYNAFLSAFRNSSIHQTIALVMFWSIHSLVSMTRTPRLNTQADLLKGSSGNQLGRSGPCRFWISSNWAKSK